MDWVNPNIPTGKTQGDRLRPHIASEPVEESEHDMFSLATGFNAGMCKRAASAQGETTLGFEVPGDKRLKWLGLNEEVQKSPIVITSLSPERAFNAFPTLEGAS